MTLNGNGFPSNGLPKAKDFVSFLNKETLSRERSGLKGYLAYRNRPGMSALGGGLPHPSLFSFQSIDVSVNDYTPRPATVKNAAIFHMSKSKQPSFKKATVPLFPDLRASVTLGEALQYGEGRGLQKLVTLLSESVEKTHKPKYCDWSLVVTSGNTDAMDKCLRLFCEQGDAVLVEEFSYPSAMEQMRPLGLHLVPVKVDAEGMVPSDVIRAASDFRMTHPESRLNLIYVVPTGQNPLGTSMSTERRQQFYKACQSLDLVILEDDPYSVLQLPPFTTEDVDKDLAELEASYSYAGNTGLMPSLLSFDTDGRVVYMYTYSKVLAPGCRLGYIVTNDLFAEKFTFLTEVTTQGSSGISQAIVTEMLSKWTPSDHYNLAIYLQKYYTHKRNVIVRAAMRALNKSESQPQVAEFVVPTSGMFIWIKVNLPDAFKPGIMKRIFDSLIQNGVLVVPGMEFCPSGRKGNEDAPYFRAAFSYASDEDLERAMTILGRILRDLGCGQS
ncbi:hypothetical protein SeMB42_g02801 [Synchytrium endobioticum]|uniref:Aminotransferase class I/classII large domain-containing protein n=1 Tax=Synchytrium endobioticum TaxID=286115 RepID=A0A507DC50_9FUNG|nr:hypothetical protein SeLEV6574_g04693 [Synchytrium endobioticum]TPX48947.1 hypothetical protein SeMB42_g02801 [Synchytrium endobioticum]